MNTITIIHALLAIRSAKPSVQATIAVCMGSILGFGVSVIIKFL